MSTEAPVDGAPLDAAQPNDRVPLMLGILMFAVVVVVVVVLLPARHDLPAGLTTALPWIIIVGLLVAFRTVTPGSRLEPGVRRRRDRRRLGALGGALAALLLLGGIATTAALNSWGDFLILGSFVTLTIGLGIMLNTRFTIG